MEVKELIEILKNEDPNKTVIARNGSRTHTFKPAKVREGRHISTKGCVVIEG